MKERMEGKGLGRETEGKDVRRVLLCGSVLFHRDTHGASPTSVWKLNSEDRN